MLCGIVISACDGFDPDSINGDNSENQENPAPENPEPENPEPENPAPEFPAFTGPFTTASLNDPGISYIWDENVIPEITIQYKRRVEQAS